jgi:hypothetical protein
MQHPIESFGQQAIDRLCVEQVRHLEPRPIGNGAAVSLSQVVDDYNFVTGREEFRRDDRTNVARPPCNE